MKNNRPTEDNILNILKQLFGSPEECNCFCCFLSKHLLTLQDKLPLTELRVKAHELKNAAIAYKYLQNVNETDGKGDAKDSLEQAAKVAKELGWEGTAIAFTRAGELVSEIASLFTMIEEDEKEHSPKEEPEKENDPKKEPPDKDEKKPEHKPKEEPTTSSRN